MLVPLNARRAASEEFRHIKRPIVKAATAADGDGRQSLVMVTSALPGEGKTFFSLNLAMSLATEVDTSVLLVDADVLRPSILQSLRVSADRGLLDLLTDERLQLDDVVLSTNVPKLQILGAGSTRSMMSELLASARMEALMTQPSIEAANRRVRRAPAACHQRGEGARGKCRPGDLRRRCRIDAAEGGGTCAGVGACVPERPCRAQPVAAVRTATTGMAMATTDDRMLGVAEAGPFVHRRQTSAADAQPSALLRPLRSPRAVGATSRGRQTRFRPSRPGRRRGHGDSRSGSSVRACRPSRARRCRARSSAGASWG